MAQRSSKYKKPELDTSDRLFAAYAVITNDTTQAITLLNPSAARAKTKEKGTLRFARPGIREECARLRAIQAENRAAIDGMGVAQMDEEVMRVLLEIMRAPEATAADKKAAGATYGQLRKIIGTNNHAPDHEDSALDAFIKQIKLDRGVDEDSSAN